MDVFTVMLTAFLVAGEDAAQSKLAAIAGVSVGGAASDTSMAPARPAVHTTR